MGLLILTVVSMVGLAVYFQSEYKSLAVEYNSALEKLQEKNAELDKKIQEVNETRQELESRERSLVDIVTELNLTKEKQASLGGFFENLKGEKQVLEENLNETRQEVASWKVKYNDVNHDLSLCNKEVSNKVDLLNKEKARQRIWQSREKTSAPT